MKLNKKEKNYLLSTLFKGYVIQCAICSVLIFGGNSPQVCFVLLLVLQNSISLYSGCNRVGWLYYILDIPTFEKSSRLCVRGTGCDRKNVRSECQLH